MLGLGAQAQKTQPTGTLGRNIAAREERPALDARIPSDDEILGLMDANDTSAISSSGGDGDIENGGFPERNGNDAHQPAESVSAKEGPLAADPETLRLALDANPEIKQAVEDASAYREYFATPEEARNSKALLADLNRMDALFFSQRAEDHAELARSIAELSPPAFASLARAMQREVEEVGRKEATDRNPAQAPLPAPVVREQRVAAEERLREQTSANASDASRIQTEFLQATNAAAVQSVPDTIESQVGRLLPDGASRSARNRVVGEIYRELDAALRENRQLTRQVREAFRSGELDTRHQHAIVSLITGRARQALPGVAKRVMDEWTSTVVAANEDRRARQRAAERRVDIAGSRGVGGEGRRSTTPRDIDYARMSDADILNL